MHNPLGCMVSGSIPQRLFRALISTAALGALYSLSSVQAQVNIPTYHMDNARTGLNAHEVILRPSLVNSLRFGKLFSYPVDGYMYAQPLYLSNIAIKDKGSHNIVIAATENDSLYAFDADDNTGANTPYLWYNNLIPVSEMVVTSDDVGTGDLVPVIGITGTPVIDQTNGTLYLVAKTKDGIGNFYQRLHALDIHTGIDKAPPVLIQASINGVGDGSVNGVIAFNPLIQHQRSALLFSNGVVTIAWASHGDNGPYHGWLINYHYNEVSHTFTQTGVFNTTPNGRTDPSGYPLGAGGVWMAGGGPAADNAGHIYFETGNGSFDSSLNNYGDSFLRLTADLSLSDYFTPYNQDNLTRSDADLGSGGTVLLPDSIMLNGHSPLMVGAGKEGTIYLIDRNNLGQFTAPGDNIVAELPNAIGGSFGTPAYFNNSLYYVGAGDTLKSFGFISRVANPKFAGSTVDATKTSFQLTGQGPTAFGFPGATPAVSSNGNYNGIVWALQTDAYFNSGPSILHAYDAANVATELYNSNMVPSRDNPGGAVKFTVPTIANGKVFVGTANQLAVFGLLNHNHADLLTNYSNTRKINGGYAIDVAITNRGNKLASNIQLTRAILGIATMPKSPSLPLSLDTLLVGQSETTTLIFPTTAGKSGSLVSFGIDGTWRTSNTNNGKLNASFTVRLP